MSTYWRDRELEHIKKNKKSDAQIAKAITSNQRQTMKEIEQQIEAFYGRYATVEGISMAEARKRVSKLDIEAYAAKAKRYVKGAHSDNEFIKAQSFTDLANEEMRVYNLTMRVNRLELLKANIALELAAMTSDEERFLLEKFTAGAREEYLRQSGILGATVGSTDKKVLQIVNASFHNATWSERLWTNQQALKAELNTLINRSIIQGKNPRVVARDLRKSFDVSVYESERLAITEISRIQTMVKQDAFEKLGIEKFEFIAEVDERTSDICLGMDGTIHDMKDAEVGVNIPPLHPRCRSSISPVSGREAFEKDLDGRGL